MKKECFSFVLRSDKPNKDGLYVVRLRLTKNRIRKYISLNLFGDINYWSEENERFVIEKGIKNPEKKKLKEERLYANCFLDEQSTKVRKIISELEERDLDWTLNQFEEKFLNKVKQGFAELYFKDLINILLTTGHIGNAHCYERTLHMLQLFDNKFSNRTFGEIDIRYVNKWNTWMQLPRKSKGKGNKDIDRNGCSGNTRRYYHKGLRAMLNKAIKEGEAVLSTYPYGKGGFCISELEEETAKRYLPSDYLIKIKKCEGKTSNTETARRLFLFSYYCYGISYADMAQLTKENIFRAENSKYIVYKRQKTKTAKKVRPIQIRINDEIQLLLDWFSNNTQRIGNYITPCITRDYSGEKLYNHIRSRYKIYNDSLKELSKELELENVNLTSYVSRHTMAMTLQDNNIPREVISQILGHNDLQTTNTYLDSFKSSVIDEAAKVL